MKTPKWACLPVLALAMWSSSAGAVNSILVEAARLDDFLFPLDAFIIFIEVDIPDVAGVTGVTVTSGGGGALALVDNGAGTWDAEWDFTNLVSMKATLNGVWTVVVSGASPSVSTFTIAAGSLVDASFFPTTSGITPANGSTGVPANVVFSWNDPTGAVTADALVVSVFGLTTGQDDNSVLGSLLVTDTTWAPPLNLEAGPNEFEVEYLNVDHAGFVTPLVFNSGAIMWGDSPFAPVGYPPTTPLLVIGSDTLIGFDVVVACPADINGDTIVDAADLAALLGQWGAPGSADLNGDGVVNAADLANLLGSWGPCP